MTAFKREEIREGDATFCNLIILICFVFLFICCQPRIRAKKGSVCVRKFVSNLSLQSSQNWADLRLKIVIVAKAKRRNLLIRNYFSFFGLATFFQFKTETVFSRLKIHRSSKKIQTLPLRTFFGPHYHSRLKF